MPSLVVPVKTGELMGPTLTWPPSAKGGPERLFEVVPLMLPDHEAADVDMILVQGVIIAVPCVLNLEFKLVTLHRHITNRAVSPDT